MKRGFLLMIAVLLIFSCGDTPKNQQFFDEVYSLMQKGDYDIAWQYQENHAHDFDTMNLTKADTVYSRLLYAMYCFSKTNFYNMPDTAKIDCIIDFYAQTSDNEKLAWGYLLKSAKIQCYDSLWNDGVFYLKKAETIAKTLDNNELNYQIAFLKLNYDGHSINKTRKLEYLDNEGKYAHTNSQKAFYYCCKSMFFATYNDLDSARYYERKAADLDTVSYWYHLCYILSRCDDDLDVAEYHAKKVLESNSMSDEAYFTMTHILLKRGKIDEAEKYFAEHKIDNEFFILKCCEEFADYYAAHGDYKKSSEYNKRVTEYLHGLVNLVSENRVYENSQRYDYEIQQLEQQKLLERRIFRIILFSLIVAAVLVAVIFLQKRRHEKEQERNRQILKESQDKIEQLKAADKTEENLKKISALEKKIDEIENRYTEIYREGRQLYDDILVGDGNCRQWSKHEYEKFLEYYKTLDLSLIAQIEDEYNVLSPKQILFKILQSKEIDKQKIMDKMGFYEDVSFRVFKSRIEGKKR